MAAKTTCPISREDFLKKAEPLRFELAGSQLIAAPREFSTGSFGYYLSGKTPVTVDGKVLTLQVGMNLIVVGSKDLPKGTSGAGE